MATDLTHVKGMKELFEALQQLGPKIERNVARSAMTAGSKVLRVEARSQLAAAGVRQNTGLLAKSIRSKSPNIKNGVLIGGITTSGKGSKRGAFYAHWIEFGTAAHVIKAKNGGFLSFGGGHYRQVMHPGSRPHPFMRPTVDAKAQAAIAAFGEKIRSVLSTKHGIDVPQPLEDEDLAE